MSCPKARLGLGLTGRQGRSQGLELLGRAWAVDGHTRPPALESISAF